MGSLSGVETVVVIARAVWFWILGLVAVLTIGTSQLSHVQLSGVEFGVTKGVHKRVVGSRLTGAREAYASRTV